MLKKKVNRYAQQLEIGAQDQHYVLNDFSRMLDSQVSFFNHIGLKISLLFGLNLITTITLGTNMGIIPKLGTNIEKKVSSLNVTTID